MSRPLVWPNGGGVEPVYYGADPRAPFRWTSPFGMRTHPVTGRPSTMHYGLDLVGWSTIVSPVDGVVTFAGYNGGAGNEVRIRENGTGDVFRLLHNRSLHVRTNQGVRAGQAVAVMGTTGSSTGVHCHLETRPGGGAAIDPFTYYRRRYNETPAGGGGRPTDSEYPDMFIAIVRNSDWYLVTGGKACLLGAASGARQSGAPILNFVDDWAVAQLKTIVSGIR